MYFSSYLIVVCEKWGLKFVMRKVKNIEELADYIIDEFSNYYDFEIS